MCVSKSSSECYKIIKISRKNHKLFLSESDDFQLLNRNKWAETYSHMHNLLTKNVETDMTF